MKHLALFGLTLLVASAVEARDRRCYTRGNRTNDCVSYAYFEAFPLSGAGSGTVCGTTAPTGAKGEALTFTRASNATCTKTATGGLATTGIADGDLVVLSSNVARVEYDSAGTLMLLMEAGGTNLLPRYNAPGNALWSDVGTPVLVTGLADPLGGTAGVSIEDNDGAAFEGRSQPITVSAAAATFLYCYVKAGTLDKARISIDGTTQDISGLSAATWSIVEKGDASSSGVSISVQILVGNAVGDTGTVIWGGCDAKAATYRTSLVPTVGAAAARSADAASFPALTALASVGCASVTASSEWTGNAATATGFAQLINMGATNGAAGDLLYQGVGTLRMYDGTVEPTVATSWTAGSPRRVWSSWTGIVQTINNGSSSGTGAFDGAMATGAIGVGSAGTPFDGLIGKIILDPNPTRCVP